MTVALQIALVTVLLLLAQEFFRRASKWITWGVFLIAPVALTPYWFAINDFDLFQWLKLYTVLFCVCWGTLLRFSNLGNRPWARSTISLLLAANILEAVTTDMLTRGLPHVLNAASGLILIATLPYGPSSTTIDTSTAWRDLRNATSRGWVIGYTLWNWTFVYLNYSSLAGHHTAVLASAFIVAAIDPRLWTQARAYTLGSNLLVSATSFNGMISWMDTGDWVSPIVGLVAALIALAFVAIRLAVQALTFDSPRSLAQSPA